MVLYQFLFLQLILLMGAFGKIRHKALANASPLRKLRVKSYLFMVEGILQMVIAGCWSGDPNHGDLFFLAGGILWLLAGMITFLYVYKQNSKVQA